MLPWFFLVPTVGKNSLQRKPVLSHCPRSNFQLSKQQERKAGRNGAVSEPVFGASLSLLETEAAAVAAGLKHRGFSLPSALRGCLLFTRGQTRLSWNFSSHPQIKVSIFQLSRLRNLDRLNVGDVTLPVYINGHMQTLYF